AIAVWRNFAAMLRALCSGDKLEELYVTTENAAREAFQSGVNINEFFLVFSKLETNLTGIVLQVFPEPDQQTVALTTVGKFLKSILHVVMEVFRVKVEENLLRSKEAAEAANQGLST